MYSGCYIKNMYIYIYIPDVISRIWIYILDFGNLGTNVANGSIRILTLDITSRIYIYIYPDLGNLVGPTNHSFKAANPRSQP